MMLLRFVPAFTLLLLGAPIIVGLAWTVLPAFGYFPAIGGTRLTLEPWRVLFASPGFDRALLLTLTTGIGTTVLALLAAISFCAMTAHRPSVLRLRSALPPLLASPPSAMALGFAFLIMPSGWLVRLVSPWATGFDRPPIGLVTTQDALGLSLIAGLLVKEVPYLVLMILAASSQVPVGRLLATACALSQRPATAWLKAVFPQVYAQIRLPVFAVLAFSLSVVDVALILAPGNPPPLAVLATRWFSDYNLSLYFQRQPPQVFS
jgi:putative thiamine transport system permease protein